MALDHAPARRRALQAGPDQRETRTSRAPRREASFSTLTLARISTAGVSPKAASIIAPRGLGREALAPDLRRQHVAERQAVRAAQFEADRADGVALALDRRHHQGQVASGRVGFARRVDEPLGRALRDRDGECARCSGRPPIGCKIYGSPRRRRFSASAAKAAASRGGTHRLWPDRGTWNLRSAPLNAGPKTTKGTRRPHPLRKLRLPDE